MKGLKNISESKILPQTAEEAYLTKPYQVPLS